MAGPQADVANGYWGLLYEERGRGILEQYPKEKAANALVRKGDWNDFEVMAKGDHVVISINGTKVIDRTDAEFEKSGDHRPPGPRRPADGSPVQGPGDQAALRRQVERN